MFSNNSRYYGIETATKQTASNQTVVYLQRRFIPPSEKFQVIQKHTVSQGDRLDNITASYLGDPEQFWRLCDANNAMHPNELTAQIGQKLRIPLI
ncbi:MAG: LysM peptidoglycan-binding domain-containing protein [Nostoc sp. DedQUE04]|uniref:LysM peptidoglycan-binding domain-containing protein n=1 Tax=Nostoc sp. DedQUE04 TaxID=3075390 RepID=UPI002AD2AFF0|nr:LysM peptidoglycan-binding domain-containing protein [Nostoc sp. DedQUE04]MDZ8140844.1 LysM peptidoglycan-binding domain-containing protein [Nostoc sp. DedQUE04]